MVSRVQPLARSHGRAAICLVGGVALVAAAWFGQGLVTRPTAAPDVSAVSPTLIRTAPIQSARRVPATSADLDMGDWDFARPDISLAPTRGSFMSVDLEMGLGPSRPIGPFKP